MPSPLVLIALPEAEGLALAEPLGQSGLRCKQVGDARGSWERVLSETDWDAVLAEAGPDSSQLLAVASHKPEGPCVVLLMGFSTAEDAADCMRRGASDTLARPVTGPEIVASVVRAIEARALRTENKKLRQELGGRFALGNLISRDPKVLRIAKVVESVADTRANILISGESGTGKTLLARAVHQHSSRRDGPFVEVNCGALPPTLLESALFGHVRGAFTGAVQDKAGLFEAADGGTIFLDEIATASPELQVKLLRVLQDRVFERVGDSKTHSVDVRLIAATNRNLELEVREGRFRDDLYWRLHVISLELPPLRERPGDVALLAETFVRRFGREYERPLESIQPECLTYLTAFDWPGNVRQLENVIERSVLLAAGPTLCATDLPPEIHADAPATLARAGAEFAHFENSDGKPTPPSMTLKQALEGPERRIIQRALESCGGHRQNAALLLGINRTTLFNKMRKYELLDTPTLTGPLPGQPPAQQAF